ncbi:MAG: 3-hydroxyacyl-CoA dehydrogenase family protein [Nitrospinaceae bacterium]|nr:3-hydroxyacyl-CoA dehydrogenase family protein [Nitrospinaceae bacterium]
MNANNIDHIKKIAIVGGGLMGHGVAQFFAQGGYPVAMYSRTKESSERAMKGVEQGLALFVEEGISTQAAADAALARIRPVTDLAEAVGDADYITEAVVDDLALKQKIFKQMDALAPAHAILTSETSGLRMTDISRDTTRPERCITTHNYTPPPLFPVVEVVPGERTAPEVVETTCALLRKVGKEPVVCSEIPGHIGVRLTTALRREVNYIIEQGWATPEAVDTVVRSVARLLPVMGVCMLTDFTGLDMSDHSQKNVLPHLDSDAGGSELVRQMVAEGKLGVKSGEGFHKWTPESERAIYEARGRELLRWMKQPPLPAPWKDDSE